MLLLSVLLVLEIVSNRRVVVEIREEQHLRVRVNCRGFCLFDLNQIRLASTNVNRKLI